MPKVLIVEDAQKIAQVLAEYFHHANYQTQCLHHGDEVLPWLETHSADIILLDVMLPGIDGITLCKEIRRQATTPIIMVTARVEETDRLLGLELGADDYICKPFSPREVVARVKAVLRRSANDPATPATQLTMDDKRSQVHYQNSSIDLTSVEFQLLKLLANEPGRIFSREQLMAVMYKDYRIVSDRTIDSHVKKLRKKFHQAFPSLEFIHSVYGLGYKLELSDD